MISSKVSYLFIWLVVDCMKFILIIASFICSYSSLKLWSYWKFHSSLLVLTWKHFQTQWHIFNTFSKINIQYMKYHTHHWLYSMLWSIPAPHKTNTIIILNNIDDLEATSSTPNKLGNSIILMFYILPTQHQGMFV